MSETQDAETRALLAFAISLLSLRAEDAALAHAREVNLDRAAKLPSFVADEKATRYRSRLVDPPQWQHLDNVESEIVVVPTPGT